MKTLDEVLYELLLFNILERRALLLRSDKTRGQIYKAIGDAIKDHYIREKTTVYYRDRKRYQYSFLSITTEGIRYILSNEKMHQEHEWLDNISFKPGKISILNTPDSNYSTKKSIQKYISLTTSALFAMRCGADVHPMYIDLLDYDSLEVIPTEEGFTWKTNSLIDEVVEEDAEDNSSDPDVISSSSSDETQIVTESPVKKIKRNTANPLSKIIISAYKADREYGSGRDYSNNVQLFYLNSIELKHIAVNGMKLAYESKPDKDLINSIADVRRGRCSGILRGPEKVIMMYVETSYRMQWNNRLLKGDMDARSQYIRHLKSHGIMSINENFLEACLLVRNTEEFVKNFYDNSNSKDNNTYHDTTDESIIIKYDRIYVIPINMDGVNYLKWLGTLDIQGHEAQTYDLCTMSTDKGGLGYEHLSKRIDGAGATIRLFDPNDKIPVFYGGLMDMNMLYNIRDAYTANPDLKLKVLCYRWQEEYYKALFPTIITVCNE